ncbi:MAG: pyridoxal-phosphate-dependent aminotransferase family protein [Actinomycetota bacterium]
MPALPELLMTPGPTPVPAAVLTAQGEPLVYHRGPGYGELLSEIMDGARWMLGTSNDVIVYTSSGTGGMEGAVANVCSPGEKVLVVSVGFFGHRFRTICERFGLDVTMIDYEWGRVSKAEDIAAALDADPAITTVFIQHSETSTGVCNDVKAAAEVVKARGKLLVVDAISSAGALELKVDEWGIDVCIGGSQKALGATPGIAFVSVSEQAWEAHRNSTCPRYYFDWTAHKEFAGKKDPESPWTPAISVLQGMRAAIRMAQDEGLENVWARHVLLGRGCRAGAQALGLDLVGESPDTAHVVTAVRVPEGLADEQIVGLLRKRFRIVTGPGQGPFKGQVFRIGHLGFVEPLDVIRCWGALELVLAELGYPVKFGAGVAAAEEVFNA